MFEPEKVLSVKAIGVLLSQPGKQRGETGNARVNPSALVPQRAKVVQVECIVASGHESSL